MKDSEPRRFECNYPDCNFSVQGDDETEVLEYAMEHAQFAHGIDLMESVRKIFGSTSN